MKDTVCHPERAKANEGSRENTWILRSSRLYVGTTQNDMCLRSRGTLFTLGSISYTYSMKKHFNIFLHILGEVAIYILIPGIIYLILLGILGLFGIRDLSDSISTLAIDFLTLIVVFLAFRYYASDVWNIVFQAKLQAKKIIQLIPISLLTRVPLVVVVVILYLIFGEMITETLDAGVEYQWSVFDGSTILTSTMGFLSFVILGPVHEELLYRGVIQRFLHTKYSVRTSIIYSSIVFAIAHVHPGLIISSFVLGLFMGYIFHKWNNLWYAIILHMLINIQPFILQIMSK